MIQSIGTDIVDLDRFQKILDRWGVRFSRKILTSREIQLCHHKPHAVASMAARFAAKEALIKCLPTDQGLVWKWHEMEVLSEKGGKPVVLLHGTIGDYLAGYRVHLSLSHSNKSAVAMVVLDKEG